jgi:spermidine/putrescine transport system permease protein
MFTKQAISKLPFFNFPLTIWPAYIWLMFFLVLPLGIIFVFSLARQDFQTQSLVYQLSLDNYRAFFYGPYLATIGRSIGLASVTTIVCLLISFPFAYFLAQKVHKEKQNLMMTLIVLPLWTSFLLRIYAWIILLRPTGILSNVLIQLGLTNPPVLLYTPFAVLLGMVYNYLPYMILPLYAALEKLDRKLVEAAYDLGARPLDVLFKVIVPATSKGIVSGIIMVFVPALGDYVTPDLLGGAKTMYIGNLIQNQFLTVRNWAFGSAVSGILIVLVGIAIYFYMRYGSDLENAGAH